MQSGEQYSYFSETDAGAVYVQIFDRLCDTKQRLARTAPFYTRDGASEHPELADSHGT